MPEMMPLIWLGIIVLSIVVEASTMGLVAVWFLPGALVSLVLALFEVGLPWQITVFVVLAAVMLFFGKKNLPTVRQKRKDQHRGADRADRRDHRAGV